MVRKGWHPGLAIMVARKEDGMQQKELCEKLSEVSGDRWYQAKLSRIELGKQKMDTDELVLFARVQGREWAWYLEGPSTVARSPVEANPGQIRPKTQRRRFRTSGGLHPAFSF